MNAITAPLQPKMQGPSVADLQDGLRFILEHSDNDPLEVLKFNKALRTQAVRALARDRGRSIYGRATVNLVARFQEQLEIHTETPGTVDSATAGKLNELLDRLGAFKPTVPPSRTENSGDEGKPPPDENLPRPTDQQPDAAEDDNQVRRPDGPPIAPSQPELGFEVHGLVRFADGFAASGFTVRAFDRDLRTEQGLGQDRIDSNGRFQIGYAPKGFAKNEFDRADLFVRVLDKREALLAISAVIFNAPVSAVIDVTIPAEVLAPPSLFEKIGRAIAPLLGGTRIVDLEENQEHQDVSFLSGETGFDKSSITRYLVSNRLAQKKLPADFWFALSSEPSFHFDAAQTVTDQVASFGDTWPSLDADAVRKTLTASSNNNDIAATFADKFDGWVEAFLKLAALQSLRNSSGPTFLDSALNNAGIDTEAARTAFAQLFNQYNGFTPELATALANDERFKPAEIDDLNTSFQLADLTRGDFTVVKVIKEQFAVRTPAGVRALARKSEADWVNLVKANYAKRNITIPIKMDGIPEGVAVSPVEAYGKALHRQFIEAFPTVAFSGGLARALKNGKTSGLQYGGTLNRFLDSHENFELLNTSVDEFLANQTQGEFKANGAGDNFRLELKAVQRVFKLVPSFDATNTLLADKLHSARQIYRVGETEFVRRYGGSPGFTASTASLTWNRAAETHAAVLTIVGDFKSLQSGTLPAALQNGNAALSTFPNLNDLFQTGDMCDCPECQSVLGPAAYFADLLVYLKGRNATGAVFSTVKDVLFHRRPDLGFIELNCDNGLVPLPYVDVVCEVLEDVVAAGANDLPLPGFNNMPANAAAAQATVATAFANVPAPAGPISLGASFSINQIDPADPNRWVVHGDDVTYLLKKKGAPNFFAEVLRNTKTNAEELRAYPQYVNQKAYDILKTTKYPQAISLDLFPENDPRRADQRNRSFALPFDLFAEEVRASFQQCNLQRWDLMRTLQDTVAPNNPSDGDIAAEYFNISTDPGALFDEKRLILSTDLTDAGQKLIWGESNPATWLATIANVNVFLKKTGLEYNELLALLDLAFINPTGDITIVSDDSSCDTAKKTITGLDTEGVDKRQKLDRIHRFLRLWRKLSGWKMWELDLALRTAQVGSWDAVGKLWKLDEPFLINLFYLSRIKNRLGTKATIERVCALFDDLCITTHFTKLHERRTDGLYQSLFLNRRLIHPIDTAFVLDPATGDLSAGDFISMHLAVVGAALGLSEADLLLLQGLKLPPPPVPPIAAYIKDDLSLANLSFLSRHAWLSKTLKYKAADWVILVNILQQNLQTLPGPKSTLDLLDQIDFLKATGFTPDQLDWLLTADLSAKAAPKEADVIRFLTGLRQQLQAIITEYDPVQYAFLTVDPPTDETALSGLLSSLLHTLNRDDGAANGFIASLQDGFTQELTITSLPANFVFPAAIGPNPSYQTTLFLNGNLTAGQKNELLTNATVLAATTDVPFYKNAINALSAGSTSAPVTGFPGDFTFPNAITGNPNNIPISFIPTLKFSGVMTAKKYDALIALRPGDNAYQNAIATFFQARLALKFFTPTFSSPLAGSFAGIDLQGALPADLAAKISYDPEQQLLIFEGFMLPSEKKQLDALAATPGVTAAQQAAFLAAINDIYTQPEAILDTDKRVWLTETDLDFTLAANNAFAKRLANAITKALTYLSITLRENLVVQQGAAQLKLTVDVTRKLFTEYPVLPAPLLTHLSTTFVTTAVDFVAYDTMPATFKGWYWAARVAMIWNKWKLTLPQLRQLDIITPKAPLLDLLTLPLDATGAVASQQGFTRISRLLRLRDSLPEDTITFLEVLANLVNGSYATPAELGTDVELLNGDWLADDVVALSRLAGLGAPATNLLPDSWERLRLAFYYLDSLNARAATVLSFGAAAMTESNAKVLKNLLNSKFGAETWLPLSADIQDALRERKRDALVSYLLSQKMPSDTPSQKWDNTNDLFAYYLLDVEMTSCLLTSRLVQGSGSIQLFVQRCFMGLEPNVKVVASGANGDSAWNWWTWMSKYRVWEANREVFLWPENWIEPELKKDRSQFFKDLENDLKQNEVTEDNVETAFSNYLDKLHDVAQLEIAGFFQEDDGDNSIIHVFGRTIGAEPHLYYYRTFDYRQWSPWEKVDLDIQGDYLIPAVFGSRLFLFWPVFTEVPDEDKNSTIATPNFIDGSTIDNPAPDPNKGSTSKISQPSPPTQLPVQKAMKKLRMQMAISDYRRGKWTPKKISKDYAESDPYDVEIVRKYYRFWPVETSALNGKIGVEFAGISVARDLTERAKFSGAFKLSGCTGIPELGGSLQASVPVIKPDVRATGNKTAYLKWWERGQNDEFNDPTSRSDLPDDDFALQNSVGLPGRNPLSTPVLRRTPGYFVITPPWQLSYFDQLWLGFPKAILTAMFGDSAPIPQGTWLPFFYNDQKRTFFVLPTLGSRSEKTRAALAPGMLAYYPEIKKEVSAEEDALMAPVESWVQNFDLSTLAPAVRETWELTLSGLFPDMPAPPVPFQPFYSDEQVKELILRLAARVFGDYLAVLALGAFQPRQFYFRNFYHPFVCDFAEKVYNPLLGIPALMSRETQLQDSGFSFWQDYQPTSRVLKTPMNPTDVDAYPRENVDFSPDGAYSPYNWELFYHAPLLVGNILSTNKQFEAARSWYHYIFNPIGVESSMPGGSAVSKYWITKPFYLTTDKQYVQQRIDNILKMLAGDTTVPGYSAQAQKDLEGQVLDWRTYPFEPHRIANYRTVAYQKTVVMKYLDNLVAWGDYLFQQDSMESINEATQLYVLAAEILGPRPKKIPTQTAPSVETFNELEDSFDSFSNALIAVENYVPGMPGTPGSGASAAPLPMLYFCIPENDKLLGYWDTVADRLYKIRHCMNIEGVVRQLALFEPPIDPGALVKAVAAGLDISAALADLNSPLPLYRFNVMLQKTSEVCNEVKALGSALLTALEKQDAEALSRLRQGQEISLLEAAKAVRENQVDEANENLEALKKNREMADIKKHYYESRDFMNLGEGVAMTLANVSLGLHTAGTVMDILGGVLAAIPDFDVGVEGFGGSPVATVKTGGASFSKALELNARSMYQTSTIVDKTAAIANTLAGYQRRQDEWDFQRDLAAKEGEQLDKSIAAADLRVSIAEKELENQVLQIENSKATDAFMRSKYTNEELYQWQIGQISTVFFQCYQLAYDLAKQTERCFRFELGLQDSSYINFGYWDSLKKGLLSGEQLQLDLRRMEAAYLEQNHREFELTKHISLTLLDPVALVQLRETGRCFFQLPEELFDLDYPGHYFRRLKSVSLTLPCVVGPYTTISCTLRLLNNSIRINTGNGDNGYPRNTDEQGLPADDDRFVGNNIPVKAIAASSGQNDSGMFELSFRDERYLPFEGAGAISNWSLELFNDPKGNNPDPAHPDYGRTLRQYDYRTITDAVLHVKYTAREDAGPFKNSAVTNLRDFFSQDDSSPGLRMFNLRQDFPDEWYRFLNPTIPANGNIFEIEVSPRLFPFRDQGKDLQINTVSLLAHCNVAGTYKAVLTTTLPQPLPNQPPLDDYGGLYFWEETGADIHVDSAGPAIKWQLRITGPGPGGLLQDDPVTKVRPLDDLILILGYQWET